MQGRTTRPRDRLPIIRDVVEARRILLIRPSALGDVCRSVPLLASLRAAYPDASIDWLVQDSFAEAIENHPSLTSIVAFPRRALGRALRWGDPRGSLAFLARLRRARHDLVIDAQGLLRSGIFARATGARTRIGPSDAREGASACYTHRVGCGHPHTVERMLALLEPLGIEPVRDMRLYTSQADRAWAGEVCQGRSPVVIAPTSRWAAKRWPAVRFALLAREIARTHLVVIVGGAGEREQIAPILDVARASDRILDLVGATRVGQLMALVERSSLVIANDSACVHMGVGFDRPLVALYGPTDVARVGPYHRERDVLQDLLPGDRLEHKDDSRVEMMERIGVDRVLAAARQRLA